MATSVSQVFADRLKKLRTGKGLTQQQLAKELGVSRGSISYYENCDRVPDIEFLSVAAGYFGVDMSFFLGEDPSEDSYSKALILASEHFKLTPESLRNLHEFSQHQSSIVNALLSSMRINTMLYDAEKSVSYYKKYLQQLPERNRLEFQSEDGSADDEYISAILDNPEDYAYACVPMEDISDYYGDRASKEFRFIIKELCERKEVSPNGHDNEA